MLDVGSNDLAQQGRIRRWRWIQANRWLMVLRRGGMLAWVRPRHGGGTVKGPRVSATGDSVNNEGEGSEEGINTKGS